VRASRQETLKAFKSATSEGERQKLVEQFITDNPSYRIWHGDGLIRPPPDHRVYRSIAATAPHGLGGTVRCMLDSGFPVTRVGEMAMPTLVLAGAQDPGMKAVRITHEGIEQSQFKLIDDAGHLSNIDQPRDFDNAVLEFFEGADA
jgi:pimeloyl-ACP methyl ester carboxylesterase